MLAKWRFERNFVSLVTLGLITEKIIDHKIKSILHIVLKFQFDCACFQGGVLEKRAQTSVLVTTVSTDPTQTCKKLDRCTSTTSTKLIIIITITIIVIIIQVHGLNAS